MEEPDEFPPGRDDDDGDITRDLPDDFFCEAVGVGGECFFPGLFDFILGDFVKKQVVAAGL